MRFVKALTYFFKMLFSADLFKKVELALDGKLCEPAVIFSILQRDGRFIDFLMEDLSGVPDSALGAGVRNVQEGCRKTLRDYVEFKSLREEPENTCVEVEKGFSPASVRLLGNVSGDPPFRGILIHHGWKIENAKFPISIPSGNVVAPAEVEIK